MLHACKEVNNAGLQLNLAKESVAQLTVKCSPRTPSLCSYARTNSWYFAFVPTPPLASTWWIRVDGLSKRWVQHRPSTIAPQREQNTLRVSSHLLCKQLICEGAGQREPTKVCEGLHPCEAYETISWKECLNCTCFCDLRDKLTDLELQNRLVETFLQNRIFNLQRRVIANCKAPRVMG